MSRIRGPVIASRLIQSVSQSWCRAAVESNWNAEMNAIARSALPSLLRQLPQHDSMVRMFHGMNFKN